MAWESTGFDNLLGKVESNPVFGGFNAAQPSFSGGNARDSSAPFPSDAQIPFGGDAYAPAPSFPASSSSSSSSFGGGMADAAANAGASSLWQSNAPKSDPRSPPSGPRERVVIPREVLHVGTQAPARLGFCWGSGTDIVIHTRRNDNAPATGGGGGRGSMVELQWHVYAGSGTRDRAPGRIPDVVSTALRRLIVDGQYVFDQLQHDVADTDCSTDDAARRASGEYCALLAAAVLGAESGVEELLRNDAGGSGGRGAPAASQATREAQLREGLSLLWKCKRAALAWQLCDIFLVGDRARPALSDSGADAAAPLYPVEDLSAHHANVAGPRAAQTLLVSQRLCNWLHVHFWDGPAAQAMAEKIRVLQDAPTPCEHESYWPLMYRLTICGERGEVCRLLEMHAQFMTDPGLGAHALDWRERQCMELCLDVLRGPAHFDEARERWRELRPRAAASSPAAAAALEACEATLAPVLGSGAMRTSAGVSGAVRLAGAELDAVALVRDVLGCAGPGAPGVAEAAPYSVSHVSERTWVLKALWLLLRAMPTPPPSSSRLVVSAGRASAETMASASNASSLTGVKGAVFARDWRDWKAAVQGTMRGLRGLQRLGDEHHLNSGTGVKIPFRKKAEVILALLRCEDKDMPFLCGSARADGTRKDGLCRDWFEMLTALLTYRHPNLVAHDFADTTADTGFAGRPRGRMSPRGRSSAVGSPASLNTHEIPVGRLALLTSLEAFPPGAQVPPLDPSADAAAQAERAKEVAQEVKSRAWLSEVMLATMGRDGGSAVLEVRKLGLQWATAHLADLLHHCGALPAIAAGKLDMRTELLGEFVNALISSANAPLWRAAVSYAAAHDEALRQQQSLADASPLAVSLIETAVARRAYQVTQSPSSSDVQCLKLMHTCQQYGLHRLARELACMRGDHWCRQRVLGNAVSWYRRGKAPLQLNTLALRLIERCFRLLLRLSSKKGATAPGADNLSAEGSVDHGRALLLDIEAVVGALPSGEEAQLLQDGAVAAVVLVKLHELLLVRQDIAACVAQRRAEVKSGRPGVQVAQTQTLAARALGSFTPLEQLLAADEMADLRMEEARSGRSTQHGVHRSQLLFLLRQAAHRVAQLTASSLTPRRFWFPLLKLSLALLKARPVVFTEDELHTLLRRVHDLRGHLPALDRRHESTSDIRGTSHYTADHVEICAAEISRALAEKMIVDETTN